MADKHGNSIAQEGCTICECGCKYWEHDRCVDCGAEAPVTFYMPPFYYSTAPSQWGYVYTAKGARF